MGVADGVGGWVQAGVDPSKFSQALMYHCHRYAQTSWAGEPPSDPTSEITEPIEGWELTPFDCIEAAHGAVLRDRAVDAGSSTACVVTMNAQSGLLRAANLGDSGFVILRSNSLFYHQEPQTRFFNCPRQLAKLPLVNDREGFSFSDSPRMAERYSTSLRSGDIVILYTDGVSDNVFEPELVSICALVSRAQSDNAPEEIQAQAMADRIIEYACACMWNKSRVSPFERAASRAGKYWPGGKPDDATTVVAIVTEGV
ncbi:hypothetical protein EXIGLDRAFT_645479 [Exidia glandulosa HHB12029]|uniref:Protein phosphatase n=1 Tax=Exidia glandulosa HHB12029 TaxID=1314781 RepID=A0A165IH20_EXIGL|nr:hypothetical protein EXIGLDRAFT_717366 [Exidia glandulosa HHB12029]KZV94029.1 hypothetical protein EXIGLDRAFT_645479 [Exidia glandulosa HHB12029]